jgi:hypothetical protein
LATQSSAGCIDALLSLIERLLLGIKDGIKDGIEDGIDNLSVGKLGHRH